MVIGAGAGAGGAGAVVLVVVGGIVVVVLVAGAGVVVVVLAGGAGVVGAVGVVGVVGFVTTGTVVVEVPTGAAVVGVAGLEPCVAVPPGGSAADVAAPLPDGAGTGAPVDDCVDSVDCVEPTPDASAAGTSVRPGPSANDHDGTEDPVVATGFFVARKRRVTGSPPPVKTGSGDPLAAAADGERGSAALCCVGAALGAPVARGARPDVE